ncbi:hypothetical protein [Blastomonas fulva]|uniref:hypothetical protein n=1 Tax=Blastomonas fulva TaxID=1550728 RepID=UPI0025A3C3DD|nr:hypothetical protein [Blastomonas fulva]MDM7928655.1 hypothetical protein [Blastomonas fulva]MDM7964441.1 hypothetical protein [Blastomonas fulva]
MSKELKRLRTRARRTPALYSWQIPEEDLPRFDALFREAGVPFEHPLTACRCWVEGDKTPRRFRGRFGPGESCQINMRRDRTFSMTCKIAIKVTGKPKADAA